MLYEKFWRVARLTLVNRTIFGHSGTLRLDPADEGLTRLSFGGCSVAYQAEIR